MISCFFVGFYFSSDHYWYFCHSWATFFTWLANIYWKSCMLPPLLEVLPFSWILCPSSPLLSSQSHCCLRIMFKKDILFSFPLLSKSSQVFKNIFISCLPRKAVEKQLIMCGHCYFSSQHLYLRKTRAPLMSKTL